jgi:hypothetical protein
LKREADKRELEISAQLTKGIRVAKRKSKTITEAGRTVDR